MLPGFHGHLVSAHFLENAGRTFDRLVVDHVRLGSMRSALSAWRDQARALGPASSLRAMLDVGATPLTAALGFVPPSDAMPLADALVATLHSSTDAVALVVTAWGAPLDPLWRVAVAEAVRLRAPWCLLFNGRALRVVDAGRLYARRYVEFDLDLALDDGRTSAALWSLVRAEQLTGSSSSHSTPLREIVVASDRHAASVCRSLRDGVLSASTDVLAALLARTGRRARTTSPFDAFEQALTIVYRMLFLLFAEARGLVPLWHSVYRESYSLEALRDAAERSSRATGLWDALRAIDRLAHAGCRAGDLHVTPFNGRLFAPTGTPLANRRDLDDEAARRSVLALSTRRSADGAGRERISYRDLGVEQLGAVYETLLDYQPRFVRQAARQSPIVTLERGSGLRKETGTFYTPQPIAEYLVRRALAPLVHGASAERILQLRIVDPAMGSGAFLVAACRYLAHAYEAALVREGGCLSSDLDEPARAAIRRRIAERCLYGVDVNPMAVQLARLSLWLATLASDRPLTFLDHHLQVGDSLVGAPVAFLGRSPRFNVRRPPLALPLFDEASVRATLQNALPVRFKLEAIPDDTIEQVREKERSLAALNAREGALSAWKRVADLWCALWFSPAHSRLSPQTFGPLSDALLTDRNTLSPSLVHALLDEVGQIAAARRFLHWDLEFPEVFFEGDGTRKLAPGFDAVIGNPPWDMLRVDRNGDRSSLVSREDVAALVRFTRDSGIYRSQSSGHANRYQLFVERALSLVRSGGRLGLVLPSGLSTDRGSTALRRRLLTECDVDAIIGFDNQRGVFPIHRSVRFQLITARAGSPTRSIACRLGEHDPSALESAGDEGSHPAGWFSLHLTPDLLERLSPETLAIPELRGPMDLAIAERAVELFLPVGDRAGWAARFGRELNATDDRDCFRPPGSGLPIVEGKQLSPFRVDTAASRCAIRAGDAERLLRGHRFARPRLGYRDVAASTNRLTLIAAILPAGCVTTHTVFCLRTPLARSVQHFLVGLFNTFVVNYLVRLRVTTHVRTEIVEGLPVPRRSDAPRAFREVAALARILERRDDETASARLQAIAAGLYQLTIAEFEHVLGTFPLVPRAERDRALEAYRPAGLDR